MKLLDILNVGERHGFNHIIAVGDVHGSYEKLIGLLEIIPQDSFVVFVGDLIHKGDRSKEVVDLVRRLCREGKAVCVLGNHEAMAGKREEFRDGEIGLTEDDISWLRNRPLFYRMEYFTKPYLFLHAGIDRGSAASTLRKLIDDGMLPKTGPWGEGMVNAAIDSLSRKLKEKIGKLKYVRYLNPKGNFVGLGQEDETCTWWAQDYDGEFGHVYYGHQPFKEPRFDKHATGLDTEAYAGGPLTGIDVCTGTLYTSNT